MTASFLQNWQVDIVWPFYFSELVLLVFITLAYTNLETLET